MTTALAETLVTMVGAYAAAGAIFALPFVVRGVGRIDPAAREASWGFRLLIVPGTVLFWPLLLLRWAAGSLAPPTELNAHRLRAKRAR